MLNMKSLKQKAVVKIDMKSLEKLKGGEIFAIPLFTSDIMDNISFAKNKFEDKGKEFAFCRIIYNKKGSGLLIEVFDLIGSLNQDLKSIISSNRLFRPIAITGLGIYKKRWKKLYEQKNYDKERDSNYSKIQLVLGAGDDLRLWQNGTEKPINKTEAENYEIWTMWRASHLEKRIIKELFGEITPSN